MAKKPEAESKKPIPEQIKEAVADKSAVIGSAQVIKLIKSGGLRMVVLASNCPEFSKKSIEQHAKGIRVERYEGTGRQLGTFCGKPFSIAVMGIKK